MIDKNAYTSECSPTFTRLLFAKSPGGAGPPVHLIIETNTEFFGRPQNVALCTAQTTSLIVIKEIQLVSKHKK